MFLQFCVTIRAGHALSGASRQLPQRGSHWRAGQVWSGLPVRMWDERQSTCEAADILSETGTFGARRKEILDSVSATVILEDYLAWRKEHPGEI